MSDEVILELDAVTVPGVTARVLGLSTISLTVAPGDLVVLEPERHVETVSLYDVASGLIDPEQGVVRFRGQEWRRMGLYGGSARRERIGRIFAVEGWVSNLNMFENIALAQRHHTHRSDRELRKAAAALLERIGMRACLDMRPHTLSRGEQRRAQWVRAFLGMPDLLLLNAPLLNIRPDGHAALIEMMAEARAGGAGVVWKSHDAAAFMEQAGVEGVRCGTLRDGTLHMKSVDVRDRGAGESREGAEG